MYSSRHRINKTISVIEVITITDPVTGHDHLTHVKFSWRVMYFGPIQALFLYHCCWLLHLFCSRLSGLYYSADYGWLDILRTLRDLVSRNAGRGETEGGQDGDIYLVFLRFRYYLGSRRQCVWFGSVLYICLHVDRRYLYQHAEVCKNRTPFFYSKLQSDVLFFSWQIRSLCNYCTVVLSQVIPLECVGGCICISWQKKYEN